MKANLSNWLMTEEDMKDTICISGSDSNRLIVECLSHPELAIVKGYPATNIHLPNYVRSIIAYRWQYFRETTRAWLIPFTRHRHTQCFMGTHEVIRISPVIEASLAHRQVREAVTTDEFCFESSVQAFVFALSLRMVWSAVTDAYTQTDQPYCQARVWIVCISSPGRAIVHEHPVRHSIAPEDGCQMLHNSLTSLIGTCLQAQQETRAVIQHSQGMTASTICQWEVSLEVHLPQLIHNLQKNSFDFLP